MESSSSLFSDGRPICQCETVGCECRGTGFRVTTLAQCGAGQGVSPGHFGEPLQSSHHQACDFCVATAAWSMRSHISSTSGARTWADFETLLSMHLPLHLFQLCRRRPSACLFCFENSRMMASPGLKHSHSPKTMFLPIMVPPTSNVAGVTFA